MQPSFHLEKIQPLIGFAASTAKQGEKVQVLYREAITSDDSRFYRLMDSISSTFLCKNDLTIHSIHQFLILLHDDLTADVYLNNLPVHISVTAKRAIVKGETILTNDIADI